MPARSNVLAVVLSLTAIIGVVDADPVRRMELDGLVAYSQSLSDQPLVLRAYLRAGRSVAGSAAGGVADLMATWMVLGGTRSLPGQEFAAARAELNVELVSWADRDLVVVEARVPRAQFRPGLRLFADLIMYPSFDPSVEQEARVATARITHRADPAITLVRQAQAVDALGSSDLGSSDLGSSDLAAQLTRATRDDVVKFHRNRVGANTTFVSLTGPLDDLDIERELRAAYLGFAPAAAPALLSTDEAGAGVATTVAVRESTPGKTTVLSARTGLNRAHPDWLPLEVGIVATLLSIDADAGDVQLRRQLRFDQPLLDRDLVVLEMAFASDAMHTLEPNLRRSLERLAARGPSRSAIEQARRHVASVLLPPTDAKHAAAAYAVQEALGAPALDPDERLRRLELVDQRAVQAALQRYVPTT